MKQFFFYQNSNIFQFICNRCDRDSFVTLNCMLSFPPLRLNKSFQNSGIKNKKTKSLYKVVMNDNDSNSQNVNHMNAKKKELFKMMLLHRQFVVYCVQRSIVSASARIALLANTKKFLQKTVFHFPFCSILDRNSSC